MEDGRPLAATGHLFLQVPRNADQAARRLVKVGVREIMIRDSFAVLELRGGTHIVVREAEVEDPVEASFDLMFEDLNAARERFSTEGFKVSEVEKGRIHRSFQATAPEGYTLRVLDSHAGTRVV